MAYQDKTLAHIRDVMLSLNWIRECVGAQRYRYSRHGDRERQNDALTLDEVEQALLNGRIIEQYPDIGRGESCSWPDSPTRANPCMRYAAGWANG